MFPDLIFKSAGEDAPPTTVDPPPPTPIDDGLPDEPPPPDAILCEECLSEGRTTVLKWSGRGRKPKRCDAHKRGSSKGTAQSSGRGQSRRLSARLEMLKGDLLEGAGGLAGSIAPVAPVSAATILMQADSTVDALLSIAQRYPRMLDGLEAAAQVAPFIQLGRFAAAVMLAVAVDLNQVQPYGIAAEALGVAKAAEHVGYQPPQPTAQFDYYQSDNDMPPPPAFKMG